MDQEYGTEYHKRLLAFLEQWQERLDGSWRNAGLKGTVSLSPSQQADPDLYVHVTKKDDKGIYVRGAKAHMTGMVNSH